MRRRYVVSYDVSDDKRRTRLFELLHDYGNHVQYSVFIVDVTARERIILRTRVRGILHEREDQCLFIDLGRESRALESTLEVLGRPYAPPTRTHIV